MLLFVNSSVLISKIDVKRGFWGKAAGFYVKSLVFPYIGETNDKTVLEKDG